MARGWVGDGKDHGRSARKKQARDFIDGFVAHGSVDQENISPGQECVPEDGDFARAGGIVRAVQVNFGPLGDAFQAAGPGRRRDAARDGVVIDGRAALGKHARRGDRRERVADLEASRERQDHRNARAGIGGDRGEREAAIARR